MDDFSFWWYIIAAVIYFLTRGKKKKEQRNSRPGSENNPPQQNQPKSFEDLLREITEGRQEPEPEEEPTYRQEPLVVNEEKDEIEDATRLEGERRAFADDESKRVYEESIKMAEGADIEFGASENYKQPRLFRKEEEEEEWTIADEIRDGLNSSEAKKAVIYSEILNRKY